MSPAAALKRPALAAVRAKLADRCEQGAAGRAWVSIPLPVREVLIMCALDSSIPARQLAGLPWGSFSAADQAALGAAARTMRAGLEHAGALR